MNKAKSPRKLILTVVEVEDVLASLSDAQALRDLTGQQRQQLAEAANLMKAARQSAVGENVVVPIESYLAVLRCVSMTQRWLREMLTEMSVADENE